jgi:polysaccharide deacetylase family protein (PEP-CTERM system associated)
MRPMLHAFTVDLEDWYHGIPVAPAWKATAEKRLHVGTDRLLELLERHNVKATFFVLSPTVREHKPLLTRIVQAGHDIGSHGLSHDLIYEMGPQRFTEETRASIGEIQDTLGCPVTCYRAAYFSITQASLWALETLVREGIQIDSSIFPIRNWRYGIPDYSRRPVVVETAAGKILEFPISTRRVLGRNLPETGGAYFRIYPYALTRANVRAAEAEGRPHMFYIHPWELDPDHPLVPFKPQAMATHYFNLRSTVPKLQRLLSDFQFSTMGDVLRNGFPELGSSVLRA